MNTKPSDATHSHSLGNTTFFYKKDGSNWLTWSKNKKWEPAMINTVNTQANGNPFGFVELQDNDSKTKESTSMVSIKKVTLGEHNGAGQRNGCRDTGTSIVWQVIYENLDHIGVSRKRDAQLIADLINENLPEWDGSGCIELMARSFANQEQLIKLNDIKVI